MDAQIQKDAALAHSRPESSGAAAGSAPTAASRLLRFGQEFKRLKEAADGVLENLWPDAPLPAALHDLATRLEGAPVGINEQVEMAARGGTNMPLAVVKSWYPGVQMSRLLDGFRTGTSLASLPPEIAIASGRVAEAVDLTKLVPAEPSSTPQPAEDTGTGNAAAATTDAAV